MSTVTAFGEEDRPAVGMARGSRTAWPGLIDAFRDRLPVTEATPVVTLFEGGTPLVPAHALPAQPGCEVYLKPAGRAD